MGNNIDDVLLVLNEFKKLNNNFNTEKINEILDNPTVRNIVLDELFENLKLTDSTDTLLERDDKVFYKCNDLIVEGIIDDLMFENGEWFIHVTCEDGKWSDWLNPKNTISYNHVLRAMNYLF